MKILSLSFSMKGTNSLTAHISDRFVDRLKDKLPDDIQYECITADKMHIEYCRGCNACFYGHTCPLSSQDDVLALRQKIDECDLLIFASPVYFVNLSGICKSFIDRSSDWSHHMPIIGKPCVHIATADREQCVPVLKYMELFTGPCGGLTLSQIAVIRNTDEEEIEAIISKAVDETCSSLADPLSIPHERQRTLFKGIMQNYRLLSEWRASHPDRAEHHEDPYEERIAAYSDYDEACHALFGYPCASESRS